MQRVALVTAEAMIGTDVDMDPLLDAVRSAGVEVDAPCWDDRRVRWDSYDLAVIRSTWDYTWRYDEFLDWLHDTEQVVPVLNPSSVVRWSTDKHYLAELAERAVPVVPTEFFEPGGPPPSLRGRYGEVVVKPTISAGSKDTMRHSDLHTAEAHVRDLLSLGRAVMVQPYQAAIDTYGETGMVFFNGELSHGFRKAPILALDAPPTDDLFAPEEITAREPSADERAVAEAALEPFDVLLYARVDVVPDADGQPLVLELELAEPSYFLAVAPGAADRFAAAVAQRLDVLGSGR